MKKYYLIGIVLVVILLGYYGVNALFTKSYEIPTANVQRGEFIISLDESGSVDAKRAMTLSAPRVRGLQITWLAPEGSMIEEGATVIKFDNTEQLTELTDNESNLKINKNSLERARKEYTIQEKQLKLDLEKAKRNYDEKKYDAPRIAEEAKMEFELAELNFEAKLEQLKADVDKAEVEVQRSEEKVRKAQRELEQLNLKAPIPGLVVYLEIWKGGTMDKVQEGDSPWPGQGLINIPDLSEMIVKTTVSEVDASKVDSGQAVMITLDAFPDKVYDGVVITKSTLARKKESGSKINVFDVEVQINNNDGELKPGMSASSKIIIQKLPDVVSVPLEAVFEKDGKTVVYLDNKKRREISVGQKNDMYIEVIEGLDGDESVCLLDPTLDEQGLPGDKATEPEINKSEIKKPPQQGGRRGGKGRG
ncbi:MAG: efflux RND transporter periplasmic adaptor subunit [Calditrichaeota bacterium]|nr:MAG: efflux RND transporter periplasmic adaptor subunit [Calditrichota bacterium]